MSRSHLSYNLEGDTLHLSGFIDRFTVPELIKAVKLKKYHQERLRIDFSEVEKVDTAGLAWLLKIMAKMKNSGQVVDLTAMPNQLLSLAQLCGVTPLIK